MKIIVPMAGMGKRMRPHTLTIPKPLVKVAGKPIVEHLVNDIAERCAEPIDEVAFIIGDFGKAVEESLKQVAADIGAKGSIYYQREALGTAHAIYMAEQSMSGPIVVAFADTLFKADFTLDAESDGIIWTKQIDDPRAFGVVNLDDQGYITEFDEKPEHPKSDLAIIGIYYFRDGSMLRSEIKYLLDNDMKSKGEFQITDALEAMKEKGQRFRSQSVEEWMDCGNYRVTVETNRRYLEIIKDRELVSDDLKLENAVLIPPCFIAPGVQIRNSVVGPHVSIGEGTIIEDSIVKDSIIQSSSNIRGINCESSLIGNHVKLNLPSREYSIGDYNEIS